jgi:hypothetical protein
MKLYGCHKLFQALRRFFDIGDIGLKAFPILAIFDLRLRMSLFSIPTHAKRMINPIRMKKLFIRV